MYHGFEAFEALHLLRTHWSVLPTLMPRCQAQLTTREPERDLSDQGFGIARKPAVGHAKHGKQSLIETLGPTKTMLGDGLRYGDHLG